MILNPKEGDLVYNSRLDLIGKIIQVKTYWGWFVVQYPEYSKEYRIVKNSNLQLRRLTTEERADYVLKQEKLGVTDSWRE